MTPEHESELQQVRERAQALAAADRHLKSQLIRAREQRGLSQRQVAERMGVTQQAVNKFERYDSDPKLSTLRRYANAVGAVVTHDVTLDSANAHGTSGEQRAVDVDPAHQRAL